MKEKDVKSFFKKVKDIKAKDLAPGNVILLIDKKNPNQVELIEVAMSEVDEKSKKIIIMSSNKRKIQYKATDTVTIIL